MSKYTIDDIERAIREAVRAELPAYVADWQREQAEADRLARANPMLPVHGADAPPANFKGAFLAKPDAVRAFVAAQYNASDGAVRAIDSGLFASGGKLPADVANRFIDYVVERQPALSRVQVRRMGAPEAHIDELRVDERKIVKANEAQEPTPANGIGAHRRTLHTVEVIRAEDVTLQFLEDNIEKRGAELHIANLLATAFGNDLNDLGWNGDEADTGDAFVSINDGWLTLAAADNDVNVVDLSDSGLGFGASTKPSEVLQALLQAMPVRFKGRADLTFYVPIRFAERYAEELSGRATGLGDNVTVQGMPVLRFFGRPVVPDSHLRGASGDKIVFTPDANLVFGIQRNITVDSEWKPRKRVVEYTITARIDYEYATGEAIVLATDLPAHLAA